MKYTTRSGAPTPPRSVATPILDGRSIRWFPTDGLAGVPCRAPADLARQFNVHASHVSRICSGERRPYVGDPND